MQPLPLELSPLCTIDDLRKQEFLPECQTSLDAVAGGMGKLAIQLVVTTTERPLSIPDMRLRSGVEVGSVYQSMGSDRSLSRYLYRWLIEPGLGVVRKRQKDNYQALYSPAPLARQKHVPILGVLGAWQLAHPEIPLQALTGTGYTRVKQCEYGVYPTACLRAVQTALVNNDFSTRELADKYFDGAHHYATDVVTRLHNVGTVALARDQMPVERHLIVDDCRAPAVDLLSSLCSLQDAIYRAQAAKAAHQIARSPQLMQQLVHHQPTWRPADVATYHPLPASLEPEERVVWNFSEPTPVSGYLPAWLLKKIEDIPHEPTRHLMLHSCTELFRSGAITFTEPDTGERPMFSAAVQSYFRPATLRAVSRYYGIEQQMYGSVKPVSALANELGLAGTQNYAAYVQRVVIPKFQKYLAL